MASKAAGGEGGEKGKPLRAPFSSGSGEGEQPLRGFLLRVRFSLGKRGEMEASLFSASLKRMPRAAATPLCQESKRGEPSLKDLLQLLTSIKQLGGERSLPSSTGGIPRIERAPGRGAKGRALARVKPSLTPPAAGRGADATTPRFSTCAAVTRVGAGTSTSPSGFSLPQPALESGSKPKPSAER